MRRTEMLIQGVLGTLLVVLTIYVALTLDATESPVRRDKFIVATRPSVVQLIDILEVSEHSVVPTHSFPVCAMRPVQVCARRGEPFYIWFDGLTGEDGLGVMIEGPFGEEDRLEYFTRLQHSLPPLRWDSGTFRAGKWEY